MTTLRRANIFVYLIAEILSGIFSFLGFRGPAWVREALASRSQTPSPSAIEESPSVARAVAAAGKPAAPKKAAAKVRASSTKKSAPRRAAGKKVATHRTARERTESLRSSL